MDGDTERTRQQEPRGVTHYVDCEQRRGTAATQSFTLTVNQGPTITSATNGVYRRHGGEFHGSPRQGSQHRQ